MESLYIIAMRTVSWFFAFSLISAQTVFSWSICNDRLYGKPDNQDCSNAYHKMPGWDRATDPAVDVFRLFSEPQYLHPPFSTISNPYGRAGTMMVQLPKIWRSSQSMDKLETSIEERSTESKRARILTQWA